jgi:hypothetical protein
MKYQESGENFILRLIICGLHKLLFGRWNRERRDVRSMKRIRNVSALLTGESEITKSFPRIGWSVEDNFKVDPKEIMCENVVWIYLLYDRGKCRMWYCSSWVRKRSRIWLAERLLAFQKEDLSFLECDTLLSQSRNFPHFMEPEDSLPHTLQPAICPYLEPDRSSPFYLSHFSKMHFNIILPSTLGSYELSLFSGFPAKTLYAPLLFPIYATRR